MVCFVVSMQVKKGICEWLAWIVRIKRPVRAQPKPFSDTKTISIELNERSSHSLLANVLDLDDDFQTIHSPNCTNPQHIHTQRFPFSNHNLQTTRDGNGLPAHHQPSTDPPTFRERCSAAGSTCCAVTSSSVTLLQSILRELQYMTDKVKADDARSDLCSDWKFAAMVIDRLCLWLFTVFTFVSTVGIMLSAPNVIRWGDWAIYRVEGIELIQLKRLCRPSYIYRVNYRASDRIREWFSWSGVCMHGVMNVPTWMILLHAPTEAN